MRRLFMIIFFLPSLSMAQPKQDSVWRPLQVFIGNWIGSGGGVPGSAEYQTSIEYILNNKYIEIKSKSTYKPTDKNPKGEVHEERGLISYDKSRKKFILRQFHIEGFVNEYVLDSISSDRKTLVFVTESIENIPKGWRAKETFQSIDENHWMQKFELAEPGKDFSPYTQAEFIRKSR